MTTGQTSIEVPDELWRSHAERLLDELTTGGHLSRRWAQVFRAVPRHLFVPRYWALDHHNHPDTLIDPATEPDHRTTWLTAVYRDQALITTWNPTMIGDRPIRLITSSASQPSVVATMLDRLDLQPGHRVLEIGTGTGYNTALVRHEAPLFPCGDERSPPLACRSRLMKLGAV